MSRVPAIPVQADSAQRVAPRPAPLAIAFRVAGRPAPQGSMRAYPRRGGPGTVIVHDNSDALASWRGAVRTAAVAAMAGRPPFVGPVAVALQFALPRPKRGAATRYHARRPDADKLARSVLDALTGATFEDDAQVSLLAVEKAHTGTEWIGLTCTVKELRDE